VNEEYEEYKERNGETAIRRNGEWATQRRGDAAAVVGGARTSASSVESLPNVL
jgi:hypothetical protein